MNKRFTYLVLGVVLFFCGCQRDKRLFKSYSIQLSDSLNTIQFTNENGFPVTFSLKINEQFPLDWNNIKALVEEMAPAGISPSEAAWRSVVRGSFTTQHPYTAENWQHEPLLFLNSIGGGFCDDRASVLAKVWNKLGYSSRVIGLGGHVVPEVLNNDKWQLFDPDFEIYFSDSNDTVLSEKELENNSQRFFSVSDNNFLNPIFQSKNPLSESIADLYATKENNKDETAWHLAYQNHPQYFVLPSQSALKFVFDKESGLTNVLVVLDTSSKGVLRVPLVPFSACGELEAIIGSTYLVLDTSDYRFSRNSFIESINIKKVKQKTTIRYLVNPKLHFLSEENTVRLNTADLSVQAVKSVKKPAVLFGEAELFFNLKEREYNAFYRKLVQQRAIKTGNEFLRQQYALLLQTESLSAEQQRVMEQQFEKDLQAYYSALNPNHRAVFEERLKQYYPKSVFYLLLALRYQQPEYLKTFDKQ